MQITFIDHIVIVVKSIPETETFYSAFLGKPIMLNEKIVAYSTGDSKVFFRAPDGDFEKIDKDKGSLNHLAFGVRTLEELQSFATILTEAGITHSGIKKEKDGIIDYIWFDDPSGTRLEIYCRPLV